MVEDMGGTEIASEMRALVLSGTGFEHLRVERVPTPRPGPRQLLARVDCAGICTSLIKLVEQGPAHELLSGWDPARWPLILGDEGSVTIVEAGAELRDAYALGSRWVIQPAVEHAPVNHRERYRDGGKDVRKVAVGYTLGGHLAEYVLVTEEILEAGCLLPVPDNALPFAHAATAEPISCVIAAQAHHVHLVQVDPLSPRIARTGPLPGGVTVVVGAGAMGRIHVDLALSSSPRAVVVVDPLPERLDRVRMLFRARAERLGVELVVSAPGPGVDEAVARSSGARGADDVIVAVASAEAISAAQRLLGRGGVLDLFGGLKHGEHLVPLDTAAVHYRELVITGSSGGSPWDVSRALELMQAGAIDPAAHLTRIGDLEHAPELLALVKARELDGKAVVYPHRRSGAIQAVGSWTAADERDYLGAA
jgi:threonine dehydrogenase-like Zn-dependent dehydrogenase